jgi:hypothetical protein
MVVIKMNGEALTVPFILISSWLRAEKKKGDNALILFALLSSG